MYDMNKLRGRTIAASDTALLRYPMKSGSADAPCILFTAIQPVYVKNSQKEIEVIDKTNIALYMPRGIQFGDSMRYANVQGGVTETVVNNLRNIMNDGMGAVSNITENKDAYISRMAANSGSGILTELSRQKIQSSQRILNPNEYVLFDAPSVREFSLSFKFMPSSKRESEEVENIVREFRRNMYPELVGDGTVYKFPNAFQIRYSNSQGMIKFPQVVLRNASVQYNANSMSYHEDGRPIEIDLTLTFTELTPLSRVDIEAGY